MSRNTIARINLAAIKHNFECVRALAPDSKIVSVIKADGYGHGIIEVMRALRDSEVLAVACSAEAEALRNGGWSGRLLMLQGFANSDDFELAKALKTELVIHHPWQLDVLKQKSWRRGARLWLKLDSGMHRLGFALADTHSVYAELVALAGAGNVVLMSHFACADEPANPMTNLQIEHFDSAVKGFEAEHSLANSAGILNFPQSHREFVRPGIMLYGISPDRAKPATEIGLKPAMTLSTELVAIQEIQQGETLGYGATYRCPQDMRIGVAPIGYADGYPRHLRNGAPLLVNGRRAHLAGRVSMDSITVDLSAHDDVKIGDPVILWGVGLAVEEVAQWADTIAYELVCGVSTRVPRVII